MKLSSLQGQLAVCEEELASAQRQLDSHRAQPSPADPAAVLDARAYADRLHDAIARAKRSCEHVLDDIAAEKRHLGSPSEVAARASGRKQRLVALEQQRAANVLLGKAIVALRGLVPTVSAAAAEAESAERSLSSVVRLHHRGDAPGAAYANLTIGAQVGGNGVVAYIWTTAVRDLVDALPERIGRAVLDNLHNAGAELARPVVPPLVEAMAAAEQAVERLTAGLLPEPNLS